MSETDEPDSSIILLQDSSKKLLCEKKITRMRLKDGVSFRVTVSPRSQTV